jgi:hypothetical protein
LPAVEFLAPAASPGGVRGFVVSESLRTAPASAFWLASGAVVVVLGSVVPAPGPPVPVPGEIGVTGFAVAPTEASAAAAAAVTAGAIEAGRLGCADDVSAFAAAVVADAAGVAAAGGVALGGGADVAGELEPVAATGGFAIGWTVAAA